MSWVEINGFKDNKLGYEASISRWAVGGGGGGGGQGAPPQRVVRAVL